MSKLLLLSEQACDSADQKELSFHSQRVMMKPAHLVHFTAPEETAGATYSLISLHPSVILTPRLSIPRSCCSRSVSVYYRLLYSEAMEITSLQCRLTIFLAGLYHSHIIKPLKIGRNALEEIVNNKMTRTS